MNKNLDCRGLACPQPVINTKKALEEIEQGAVLTVIVDNRTAKENVTAFAENSGCSVDIKESGSDYILEITAKNKSGDLQCSAECVQEVEVSQKGSVYLITSNLFGQGSPDLGEVLMKSLFTALIEQPCPESLIFINSGVFLTTEGSPVIEQLNSLVEKGAQVLSCGTCLNYYKLAEKLLIGKVSNMFEILEQLTKSGKVINIA
ncbi:MAG: sulfurtransferase-like selenium metabolism protein YedF [Eubacteriales bacterium]|jgi:tRNA 2-thiouridine synthesizing protein A